MDDLEFDDDISDDISPVTNEADEFFREMVRREVGLLKKTRRNAFREEKDFAHGARWAALRLFEKLGHGEWAERVMQEEIDGMFPETPSRIARTIRRVMIPGSRLTAGFRN